MRSPGTLALMRTRPDSDPSLESDAPTINDSGEARTVEDLDAPLSPMTFEQRYDRKRVLGDPTVVRRVDR
ncbi:MAG: hypothetical protein ACOCUS_04970 [Polyangiales bacterium]